MKAKFVAAGKKDCIEIYTAMSHLKPEKYQEWLDNMANAYVDLANSTNAELLIMYGSILHIITDKEFQKLVNRVKVEVNSPNCKIKKSILGSMAPAMGAALLV